MAGVSCHMLGRLYNTSSEKYFPKKSFFLINVYIFKTFKD